MPGYSLAWKSWAAFHVNYIKEVDYNIDAFRNLVFAEDKQLIRSLVEQQEINDGGFDDYIKGKGKVLIFLLHGPPGVGKTFTAGMRVENNSSEQNVNAVNREPRGRHPSSPPHCQLWRFRSLGASCPLGCSFQQPESDVPPFDQS